MKSKAQYIVGGVVLGVLVLAAGTIRSFDVKGMQHSNSQTVMVHGRTVKSIGDIKKGANVSTQAAPAPDKQATLPVSTPPPTPQGDAMKSYINVLSPSITQWKTAEEVTKRAVMKLDMHEEQNVPEALVEAGNDAKQMEDVLHTMQQVPVPKGAEDLAGAWLQYVSDQNTYVSFLVKEVDTSGNINSTVDQTTQQYFLKVSRDWNVVHGIAPWFENPLTPPKPVQNQDTTNSNSYAGHS